MSDRFLFRIFYNNKMVYPNDYLSIESIYECLKQQAMWDCAINVDFKFNHIANNLVFMQCSGLKDKNGELIYEWDIVNGTCGGYWGKMIVEHNIAGFVLNKNGKYLNFLEEGDNYIKVIGNIYENPELLKECENE